MPALGAVVTNASALAADVLPAGWAAGTWSLPKTMFLVDSSNEDKAVWAAGIKPLREKGFGNEPSRFDVRQFLTAFGANLPSNAIATFEEGNSVLMVIGPRADVAAIESFYLAVRQPRRVATRAFGGDKTPLNFEVNSSFVVADSAAIVVQVWPIVRDDAKSARLQAALILRMRMLNEHGQPLREAFQRAKK